MVDTSGNTDINNSSSPRAGKREWIGLVALAFPCLLYSMDLTVLNLALPKISAELKPTGSQLLWIVDIYGFMIAGMLITMGTLGDRIGRRRLLLIGSAAFGIASILAAFSRSAEMLIFNRALLGIAGATLAPSTLSLIRNMFLDDKQRTVAIGFWITSYSVGGALGPLLGGIFLQYFHWGSVFLIGVPFMLLLLLFGPKLIPEFKDPNPGKLDLLSASLSLSGILFIIYGLKKVTEHVPFWIPVVTILIGFCFSILFVRRQRTIQHPLIDLDLFKNPHLRTLLLINLMAILVFFGSYIFTSQYLQLVVGLSPLKAGLWMAPLQVTFIIGSMLAPTASNKSGAKNVIGVGLLITFFGFIVISLVEKGGLAAVISGSIIISFGLSPVFTLIIDMIVSTASPERAGIVSSLSETSSELGGALGIAVLGSIGTAVYRSEMEKNLSMKFPDAVVKIAQNTLGEALSMANELPMPERMVLIYNARQTFTHVVQIISLICAVISFILLISFIIRFQVGRRYQS